MWLGVGHGRKLNAGLRALSSWATAGQPRRLVEQTVAPDDPDPKALACYGLLVRWAAPNGGWQYPLFLIVISLVVAAQAEKWGHSSFLPRRSA